MLNHTVFSSIARSNLLKRLQSLHMSAISTWFWKYQSKKLGIRQTSAIVVAPHQDDETFGCGGLIALKRKVKAEITVVFMTDGSAAAASSERPLAQVRREEALSALSILGVEADRVHFLEYPDGCLNQLNQAEQQDLIKRLSDLLERCQPSEIYVPHSKDHHADHEATFQLVKAAICDRSLPVDLFQYVIWGFWHSPIWTKLKDFSEPYSLNIWSVQPQKQAAIAAYHSQREALPSGFVEQFQRPFELFFKVR